MANLPYVTATGNVERALNAIKSAATPERVTQDFVKEVLNIPGGSGNQMTTFLKRIGFANSDGTPSELYKSFRNPTTSGKAAAKALRIGYTSLYVRNEYMHQLSDEKLRGLLVEETGLEDNSTVVTLIFGCIKAIKKFADYTVTNEVIGGTDLTETPETPPPAGNRNPSIPANNSNLGFNISYTINLNLPVTSDISVFNAIFESLKENLLKGNNEQI